jgi:hypothetical protein
MNLIDAIHQQIGQSELQQISQRLGIDQAAAQQAVQAAVPMVVGGMAGAAQEPDGARAVQAAVDTHAASGGMLGQLADASGAGGLLGQLLGQHKPAVQQGVQQASGLDGAQAQQLIAMLGPIVMRAIAQRQPSGQQQAGGQGLGGLLKEAAQAAASSGGGSSELSGVLGKVFGGAQ